VTNVPASAAPDAGQRRASIDGLVSLLPIATIYIWLSMLYLFEAWKRVTPWLFGDELELSQLSRSVADTGRAARRGAAHSPDSVYTYLTAPLWLIKDVAGAYAGIKYLDVFVMTSVVFPTYLLARMIVGRRAALFAAAGAGTLPSLAYSSWIVEETLAYPYAAWSFYFIAKAIVARRGPHGRRWAVIATLVALAGVGVRGELVILPIVLAFAAGFAAWSSERARARRARWSIGDWIGVVLLLFGGIFAISGLLSRHSQEWYSVTTLYKHRSIIMGNWAAGALAIGMGIIPFVAGLAALFRLPGEQPSRELRAMRSTAAAAVVGFGLYTALKASYLSTVFETRVEERNLIYVAPLLFVLTALVLERRRVNIDALIVSTAYAAYLVGYALYHVVRAPYEMGVQLYSDALGFSILQQANRYISLDTTQARLLLVGVLAIGVALLLASGRLATNGRAAAGVATVLALLIVGWNITGEIAAAAGNVSISRQLGKTLGRPFNWVDAATGGKPTVYIGQGEADHNPEWLIEFWNRSITTVSSLDGTVQGPGPAGGPNLTVNGTLVWARQYEYGVEDWPCVDLAGRIAQTHGYSAGGTTRSWRLIALAHPNRLRSMCTGLYPDGWTGASDAAYFRFAQGKPGWLRVLVSRRFWSGPSDPSPVHVIVGGLVIDAHHEPILGAVTKTLNTTIDSKQTKVCWIRTPGARFAAHLVVDKKFVPHDITGALDVRTLGVETDFSFFATRPSGTLSTCT
jgi:hypothetical protein